jgi:hypothetical protein
MTITATQIAAANQGAYLFIAKAYNGTRPTCYFYKVALLGCVKAFWCATTGIFGRFSMPANHGIGRGFITCFLGSGT